MKLILLEGGEVGQMVTSLRHHSFGDCRPVRRRGHGCGQSAEEKAIPSCNSGLVLSVCAMIGTTGLGNGKGDTQGILSNIGRRRPGLKRPFALMHDKVHCCT